MSSAHTVGLGAVCVGVGVLAGRAPGSSTPGGKGSERDAMNAPAATAAAKTTTHRMILTGFGMLASLSRGRSGNAEAGHQRAQRQPEAYEGSRREQDPRL